MRFDNVTALPLVLFLEINRLVVEIGVCADQFLVHVSIKSFGHNLLLEPLLLVAECVEAVLLNVPLVSL